MDKSDKNNILKLTKEKKMKIELEAYKKTLQEIAELGGYYLNSVECREKAQQTLNEFK